MSDRDLKFVYLFCQTDTFLFVIETPMRKCKHPFSRNEHLQNVPYLMVRSRSEYYTSMSVSGLPTFLISVKNMNLLSSAIYKHLKTYLIKHKQSLILGECGQLTIEIYSFPVSTASGIKFCLQFY
jgi:hypothetical protein